MKKLLVVLLSLGLIVAFSTAASAVDVKFGGQYYVTGQYENNRGLSGEDNTRSTADIWQRARVKMVFKVDEGLDFTTQFDMLEKMWGGVNNSDSTNMDRSNSRKTNIATAVALQENFEFEQAYVTFKTGVGLFQIGYQPAGAWGTGFGDEPNTRPRLLYAIPVGPVTIAAIFEKWYDSVYATNANGNVFGNYGSADGDMDKYYLTGTYKLKGAEAGLLFAAYNGRATRTVAGYSIKQQGLAPYLKATFGPVYVESEFIFNFGHAKEYEVATVATPDVKATGWGGYALAKMTVGPAYFGASIGYSTGDDPTTTDKDESGPKSTVSWNPGLIFGDGNYKTWIGGTNVGGTNGASFDPGACQNVLAYNVFGGFNPTPKLNIDAQLWLLQADTVKQAAGPEIVSNDYGYELDLTATYKIFDNLTYMVGAGYFWTGDYFKGTNSDNKVGNDYVLLNKLTLTF